MLAKEIVVGKFYVIKISTRLTVVEVLGTRTTRSLRADKWVDKTVWDVKDAITGRKFPVINATKFRRSASQHDINSMKTKPPLTPTNSHFRKGSGQYKCTVCGKETRSTGRGDNEHNRQCERCYDMAGDENAVTDGDMTAAEFEKKWGAKPFAAAPKRGPLHDLADAIKALPAEAFTPPTGPAAPCIPGTLPPAERVRAATDGVKPRPEWVPMNKIHEHARVTSMELEFMGRVAAWVKHRGDSLTSIARHPSDAGRVFVVRVVNPDQKLWDHLVACDYTGVNAVESQYIGG